jgi:putative hydrolase of the HAD superfamily
MQQAKLSALALASAFDAVLISEAEGLSKPDPAIFHRALERLGVAPGHAVFVGDHPDFDVAGARAAGLRAVWRPGSLARPPVAADAAIEHLGDLLDLLGCPRP